MKKEEIKKIKKCEHKGTDTRVECSGCGKKGCPFCMKEHFTVGNLCKFNPSVIQNKLRQKELERLVRDFITIAESFKK